MDRRCPIFGACTTCMATSSSGVRIGMANIRVALPSIPKGLRMEPPEWYGAVTCRALGTTVTDPRTTGRQHARNWSPPGGIVLSGSVLSSLPANTENGSSTPKSRPTVPDGDLSPLGDLRNLRANLQRFFAAPGPPPAQITQIDAEKAWPLRQNSGSHLVPGRATRDQCPPA